MQLSEGEKFILIMLAQIQKKLGVKGEIEPDFVFDAITTENTWGLKWEYPSIFSDEDATTGTVDEVRKILELWTFIEESYRSLSKKEKALVEAANNGGAPKFVGFDRNTESRHLSVARFMIEKLRHYKNLKCRKLNSHMPSVQRYRTMLSHFEVIVSRLDPPRLLSAQEIIEVLGVRMVAPADRAPQPVLVGQNPQYAAQSFQCEASSNGR
jgi:hypothetical protein